MVTICTNRFNVQQFYVLPIQCIFVFYVDLRTNSELCHLQHKLIGFYNIYLAFYNPVNNICTTSLTFNNCELCPHSFYVFCIYLRTNSDLCHLEHNLLVFYNIDLTFYIPVVIICTTSLTWNNCIPCLHCDFFVLYLSQNKQRIVPLTA